MENMKIGYVLFFYGIFYTLSFSVYQFCEHLKRRKGRIIHLVISLTVAVIACVLSYNKVIFPIEIIFALSPLMFIGLFYTTNKIFLLKLNRDLKMPTYGERLGRYDWKDWIASILIGVGSAMTPILIRIYYI